MHNMTMGSFLCANLLGCIQQPVTMLESRFNNLNSNNKLPTPKYGYKA